VDNRVERVVLETAGQRIVGDLTLPREGYRSRLSDYLNQGDVHFIPLTNAEITGLDGGEVTEREFVAIARSHVHLAYPLSGGNAVPG
jgi:Family of unknown function (DUF6812)